MIIQTGMRTDIPAFYSTQRNGQYALAQKSIKYVKLYLAQKYKKHNL